jgi:hypothetical protein
MAEQTFVTRIKDSDPEMFAIVTADFHSLHVLRRMDFATEEELRSALRTLSDEQFAQFIAAARLNGMR